MGSFNQALDDIFGTSGSVDAVTVDPSTITSDPAPASIQVPDPAPAPVQPSGKVDLDTLVDKYSQQFGADPSLVRAVITQESGGRANIGSSVDGARGIMQVMPETAKGIAEQLGEQFDPNSLSNPDTNIRYGSYLLGQNAKRWPGRPDLQLAAYHAAPTVVRKDGTIDPSYQDGNGKRTVDYVQDVINRMKGGVGKIGSAGGTSFEETLNQLFPQSQTPATTDRTGPPAGWQQPRFVERPETNAVTAFMAGATKSNPLKPVADLVTPADAKKEFNDYAAAAEAQHPTAYAAGQMGMTIGSTIATGVAGAAAGIPKLFGFISNPVVRNVVANAATQAVAGGAVTAAQQVEPTMEGKQTIKDALLNTAVNAGGQAVGVVPGVLIPKSAMRLVAEPLANMLFQAGTDVARGKEINNDRLKEWAVNGLISAGFAAVDLHSQTKFDPTKGQTAGEWLQERPDATVEIQPPARKEDLEALNQTPAAQNTRNRLAVDAVKKLDLQPTIDQVPADRAQLLADKAQNLTRRSQQAQMIEGMTPEDAGNVLATARSKAQNRQAGLPEVSTNRADVPNDIAEQAADRLLAVMAGKTLSKTPETPLQSTGDSPAPKPVTDQTDLFGDAAAPVPVPTGPKPDGRPLEEQQFSDKTVDLFGSSDNQLAIEKEQARRDAAANTGDAKIDDLPAFSQGRAADEAATKQEKLDIPDGPTLKRNKGLGQAGSIGSGPQKPAFGPSSSTPVDPKANRYQRMLNRGWQQQSDRAKFNFQNLIDNLGEMFVDVNYRVKRKLAENPVGRAVIQTLDMARGASARGQMQYHKASTDIESTIPHDLEKVFNEHLEAKRTLEVSKMKGGAIQSTEGLGTDHAKAWLDEFDKRNSPEVVNSVKVAEKKFWGAMLDQVKQKYDAGMMSKSAYESLVKNHQNYTPRQFLQHMDPDAMTISSRGGKTLSISNSGLKALDEGSDGYLLKNWRLMLGETIDRTQRTIAKNKANQALFDYASADANNGLGVKIAVPTGKDKFGVNTFGDAPAGYDIISVMKNGQREGMLMPKENVKSWVLSDPLINDDLARWVRTASGSGLVKAMATGLNPEFAVNNIPRDFAYALFRTREFNPVLPIGAFQLLHNYTKVIKDAVTRQGRFVDYINDGGGMEYMSRMGAFTSKNPWEVSSPVTETLRNLQKYAGWLGETSEIATRLAVRERAMQNGKTALEASHTARTMIDFAQGGSVTKAIDTAVPYFNAGVQGTRGIIAAFREDPKIATFKAAQMILFSVGLGYWRQKISPDATEAVGVRRKESSFVIPLPWTKTNSDGTKEYHYISIAKDQGQRIFSAIGETIGTRLAGGAGLDSKKQIGMAASDLIPVDLQRIMPPTLSATLGYLNNQDFWKQEDIWKGRKVSPELEAYAQTPEFLKQVASFGTNFGVHLSPSRMEYVSKTVLPENPYTTIMGLMSDVSKDPESSSHIADYVSKMPGVRKVIRQTYPDATDYEALDKKAEKMGIDPTGMTKRAYKDAVAKAELKANDQKQTADLDIAKLISENGADSHAVRSYLSDMDVKEQKRLAKKYDIPIAFPKENDNGKISTGIPDFKRQIRREIGMPTRRSQRRKEE